MVVGEFTTQVDVAVIGAGAAGIAAALEAADRGRTVALVTHGDGQRVAGAGPDLDDCQAAGITVVPGDAVFRDGRSLAIPDNALIPRLRFRRAILAIDGLPAAPAWAADVAEHHRSTANLIADDLEEHDAGGADAIAVLVAGGSVADIAAAATLAGRTPESADRITLVPGADGLLPDVDADLRARMAALLAERMIVEPPSGVLTAAQSGARLTVAGDDVAPRIVDRIFTGTSASPAPGELRLDATGVTFQDGAFPVDASLRTADPRVFAAGPSIRIDGGPGPRTDAEWAASGRLAAAGACGEPGQWIDPLPSAAIQFGTCPSGGAAFVAWCGPSPEDPDAADGADDILWFTGERAADAAASASTAAWCRLGVDRASGLLVAAAVVAGGRAPEFNELLLAVEMAAEPADLAGIARPCRTALSTTIARVAAAAAEGSDSSASPSAAPRTVRA
ncbi:MAG: FAD-dependent oxidoreductase [Phycisphaerales bacterium]